MRRAWLLAAAALAGCATLSAQVKPRSIQTAVDRQTDGGVRFAFTGPDGVRRAPLLFCSGGERRPNIENESGNTLGWILAKHGFVQAAIDGPCHGDDVRPGERSGLSGWRARLEKGDPLIASFTKQAMSVIDYLVRQGTVDPERIGAAGSSRGGFLSLHLAAADPRIKFAVAFAPVTDLLALREFHGMADTAPARALDVMTLADKLLDRPIWLSIADNDERVGSRHAIDFMLHMMRISRRHKRPMTHFWSGDDIRLTVTPAEGAGGHVNYSHAQEDAAAWVLRQLPR
jgi:dienelactone hydrolase